MTMPFEAGLCTVSLLPLPAASATSDTVCGAADTTHHLRAIARRRRGVPAGCIAELSHPGARLLRLRARSLRRRQRWRPVSAVAPIVASPQHLRCGRHGGCRFALHNMLYRDRMPSAGRDKAWASVQVTCRLARCTEGSCKHLCAPCKITGCTVLLEAYSRVPLQLQLQHEDTLALPRGGNTCRF
jgi:hypothetical protein